MRLINTSSLEIDEFFDADIPEYAILSHTWQKGEEVHLQEAISGGLKAPRSRKLGHLKILRTCELAKHESYDYLWIDTCCIDKSSSAELSEAINSMYKWYQNARICYVFMSDVVSSMPEGFAESRWFTRVWTLQELLAPTTCVFYDRQWRRIGTKSSLLTEIGNASGILKQHIQRASRASIAQKMSWASKRNASREEDIAYSLMGLFDVNMPLLYGEGGKKAFLRLQEQILRVSTDESIFAWTNDSAWCSGLLAYSPRDFAKSGEVRAMFYKQLSTRPPVSMTNRGIEIDLEAVHDIRATKLRHLLTDDIQDEMLPRKGQTKRAEHA